MLTRVIAAATLLCASLSGCAGFGGFAAEGDRVINVIMVNNPQMTALQRLTAEHFTAETGIAVNYTVLPENSVRAKIAQEFAVQAGQYDVATISNYEVPTFAGNGWLAPMSPYLADDTDFDIEDVLPSVRESLAVDDTQYAMPFYGESSMLMYRKDILEAEGLEMADRPTWDEVAEVAAQVDGARPGLSGICLRGLAGWGEVFAPLTTVVNTYGGAWFEEDWTPGVDSPEFAAATQFYVDLVREHGQAGAAQSGFAECLNTMTQGNAAMWYDATSAAGLLNAPDSPVRGKIGYAQAPVAETEQAGWLYAWAWGIQESSENQDDAWEFVSWASSSEYEELVGEELGWAEVPAGKRASLYENPDYLRESPFAEATLTALEEADPADPGVQPRPALGIQFVAIPEFADLATDVSQGISSAIAGDGEVGDVLATGQQEAEDVAASYQ